MDIQSGFKSILKSLNKHDVEIRIGIGIGMMLIGTASAIEATPKALKLLEEEEEKKKEELTTTEKVKTIWKLYLPIILLEVLGVACIVDGNVRSSKRNAALVIAYGLSESALKEYQDKVVETLGEKKEQKIHDEIAKNRLQKNPIEKQQIIVTGNEPLCYDSFFDRYFECSADKIRKAENDINYMLRNENYVTLNDFYYLLNNPKLRECDGGEILGWNINDGPIELIYSSQLTSDDTPCMVISFRTPPHYYYKSRY